ncbi:MAG TPA: BTAD domain-containing putative transcriptional regulator [Streptomyces sp.]|jgi:DNA-binding SARP family transcriptional activator|nr:BTAD domain-containing putative transcriptional regulator [Streptomyces sp.]
MSAEGIIGHEFEQQVQQLRFAVLGPVRARRGDQELAMGSPQQRALLAALLLRGGHTMTAEELIDAIWGEEPPDQAKAALRTYASRIRKALGPDAELVVSESGGYAVRKGRAYIDVALDLDTATAHVSDAEKSAAGGDRSRARDSYAAALEQWSGEPLAHVPGPFAERHRDRLTEWQLSLQEHRLDLDLQLGDHTRAIGDLTALTAAHPLSERLRELLMLALYRSGRQAEALAVYADTRRLLADELGVDPCAELAEIQQRILGADESLALAPDEPSGPSTPKTTQPAQLPATVADFTGRAAFVAELRDQLAQAEGTVMAVSAVAGIGGVGKTTLAVHVAHAAAEHFPDGQLYVDLQGAGPSAAEPATVLGAFLRALGVEDSRIPESVEERSGLFRSLLSGRRVLTLLDNARDAAQVRPLLAGAPGCAALVTSRARMIDLAGAHLIDLDVMSPDEAMTLFTRIVGEERVSAERHAAMDVVGACGFLPLAIRIAAARLASRRTWTVSALASKLADEHRRLDELQVGDQAVKATFELGYGQLDAESARAFRLLGLADGPDISVHAAAAVLDLPAEPAEDLLESLVDASLLESAAPGRYRFHDLVRLFARVCAERDEQPPSEREAALSRLLDFYLATASRVFTLETPGERGANHLIQPRTTGMIFADQDAALDWLFSEADCVLACVQQSAERGMLRHAADLLITIKDYSDSGAHSLRYERAVTLVRDAAHAAEDLLAEARTQTLLGHVNIVAGRWDEADVAAERALVLAEAVDDPLARCWSLNDRGIIANCQNRLLDGESYLLRTIDACRQDGNRPSEASALCNLAHINLSLDRADKAIRLARQGLEIYESLNHRMRIANAMLILGRSLASGGQIQEGLDHLERAAVLFRDTRQPLWEGVSNFRMAEAHLAARRPAKAAGHAEKALALRGIGGEWMRGRMLTVLGRALVALGQRDRAHACWKDALNVFDGMGASDAEEVRGLLTPAPAA